MSGSRSSSDDDDDNDDDNDATTTTMTKMQHFWSHKTNRKLNKRCGYVAETL